VSARQSRRRSLDVVPSERRGLVSASCSTDRPDRRATRLAVVVQEAGDEVDRVAGGPADRMAVNRAFSDRMLDVSSPAGSQIHGM
jgi:hypothetical protein